MTQLRTLYHLMRADFLERVRRYSFLITLLAIVAFTYLCLPAPEALAWLYLNLGNARPIYNSAWIGLAVTMLLAEFLPLFGFYLVKNTLERDRRTGVGEIVAATQITKPIYTLGKWLSNMAVFGAVIGASLLTSLILQFVRAQEFAVDLWALVAPFLLILLPELAFIAALAVLFESINWLRGGLGNLVYYGIYAAAVLLGDLQGTSRMWSSVYQACSVSLAACTIGEIEIGADPLLNLPTFRYEGVSWTVEIVGPRLVWIVASVAVALLAAAFFHRFDPSRMGKTPLAQIKQMIGAFISKPRRTKEPDDTEAQPAPISAPRVSLTPLAPAEIAPHPSALRMVAGTCARVVGAELRLTLKGLSWLWYLVAAAIVVSALFVPLEIARLVVLPLAAVWPVLVWSSLGVREVQHHTAPIVFALPFPLRRQLLATWLAGVLVALAMSSTVVARLALTGDWGASLAALIGALFVPSFALALGCWSGTGKLFQAVYLFLWYLGAVQGVVWVDFVGHLPDTVALGIPWIVAILTLGLLIAAALGRRHQVRQ